MADPPHQGVASCQNSILLASARTVSLSPRHVFAAHISSPRHFLPHLQLAQPPGRAKTNAAVRLPRAPWQVRSARHSCVSCAFGVVNLWVWGSLYTRSTSFQAVSLFVPGPLQPRKLRALLRVVISFEPKGCQSETRSRVDKRPGVFVASVMCTDAF